ncbi:DNA-binding protein [Veillonella magna]|uniref:ICEBs1 excisionase n=1 Tax=Veillonella magna TaxID=464322 RepID=A0ABS2GCG8_9FIRM|nr:DNA-binding protein [Veillonella magna]MBM6823502.1 hypothetical protein [Veillonella magna]MBM6911846.1 hypothetical protein [Veillonella magna]
MKEAMNEIYTDPFMTAKEVAKVLGVGISKSYQTIRLLNQELESKGFLIIPGKIQREYFYERYGIGGKRAKK